ncbi:MAG: SAM-dependent methyltransferase [Alphaproteobacteria bacterium]|nr:SAM-dependent methyltransferase [Alphaproteobacteria bacterium]
MTNKALGQVFTLRQIADYMVGLLSVGKDKTILDPCFGEGVFLDSLSSWYKNLIGVELDKELFGKFNSSQIEIHNTDFLSFVPDAKIHGIIMNPPYIRHEAIDKLDLYGISKASLRQNPLYKSLPANSNMYLYFIQKALDLLEVGGELIVIFPNSWRNSKNEQSLLSVINTYGHISMEIDVRTTAFTSGALVDVIILKIIKSHNCERTKKLELVSNGSTLIEIIKTNKSDNLERSKANFEDYASIRRGITTGYNEMFINPKFDKCTGCAKFIYPIISSPKNLAQGSSLDSVLIIPTHTNISKYPSLEWYINEYKNVILKKQEPSVLYKKITNREPDWYCIKAIDCHGIIFSYIIRDNMEFLLNSSEDLVRDNFYIIQPKIDKYLLLALLNNFYTYTQLEDMGKTYGNGLLKLQTYDFKQLYLPDVSKFSTSSTEKLRDLAKKYDKAKSSDLIRQMTEIIAKYEKIGAKDIEKRYNENKRRRLGGNVN